MYFAFVETMAPPCFANPKYRKHEQLKIGTYISMHYNDEKIDG